MTQPATGVREEVRTVLESEFGEDIHIQFVRDGNRLDVRVSNVGITDAIEQRRPDLQVTNYSDLRFTVMLDA